MGDIYRTQNTLNVEKKIHLTLAKGINYPKVSRYYMKMFKIHLKGTTGRHPPEPSNLTFLLSLKNVIFPVDEVYNRFNLKAFLNSSCAILQFTPQLSHIVSKPYF